MVLIDNPPTKKLIIGRPINHAHVSTGFLPAPTPDKYPATVALITSRGVGPNDRFIATASWFCY